MLIGYCLCGSFCTLHKSLIAMQALIDKGNKIIPVISYNVKDLDTRFYKSADLKRDITAICGMAPIDNIVDAEPLGPKIKCDIMVVCPCTSNTLAKIRYGITDTPVTMAVKAHTRNNRPVVISLSTNDGLGAAAVNLGAMLMRKNYYFAPLFQDDYLAKPRSLIADIDLLSDTIDLAVSAEQYQPLIVTK